MESLSELNNLRRDIRLKRNKISVDQQQQAAEYFYCQISSLRIYQQSKNIGFYLANDGEADPSLLLIDAQNKKKNCFLPCVHPNAKELSFTFYHQKSAMVNNKFGIPEPRDKIVSMPAEDLDLVIVPLVSADANLNRLGMGGGYYDKTFSFKNSENEAKPNPYLLGICYSFQLTKELPKQTWDIPVDQLIVYELLT